MFVSKIQNFDIFILTERDEMSSIFTCHFRQNSQELTKFKIIFIKNFVLSKTRLLYIQKNNVKNSHEKTWIRVFGLNSSISPANTTFSPRIRKIPRGISP